MTSPLYCETSKIVKVLHLCRFYIAVAFVDCKLVLIQITTRPLTSIKIITAELSEAQFLSSVIEQLRRQL